MVEELKRANAENRKLTEMLTVACKNYNALQAYMMECLNSSKERRLFPSTRGRSEHPTKNNNSGSGNAETSTGATESSKILGSDSKSRMPCQEEGKRAGEGAIRVKMISRVCVRTEASDSSLVRIHFHLVSTYFFYSLAMSSN